MCAPALPTRVPGETDIPGGDAWTLPTTIDLLEHLRKVMRRWAETAEDRHG